MKLDGKQVRFVLPFLPVSRQVRLVGRRNSIQLLETALVVEGNFLKLHMLGLERFMVASMSEWTTITVPYSRIVNVRYQRNMWLRLLLAGLILIDAILYVLAAVADSQEIGTAAIVLSIVLVAFGIVLAVARCFSENFSIKIVLLLGLTCLFPIGLVFLLPWLVSSRFTIEYRPFDGRKRRIVFQVLSKKVRLAFEEQLRLNRDLAGDLHSASTVVRP